MASATITSTSQPLSATSQSRQNHSNRPPSFSAHHSAYEGSDTPGNRPNMSFNMSQGSQGSGLMMQQGPYRQYDAGNGMQRRNSAPQIYSAIYSGVDVYEMEVNNIAVMRRRKDSWLNATQILKVAGIEKGKRTKVLEKEILIGEHEKVQGGYGKYQGTWIKFERGVEFCKQYGVEELLRPLLTYDMGQDGGIAGRGGIDTPTKEQAMAAQRKRLYNQGVDARTSGQAGTFFKNISSTASHAVAAISKARFDSPVPRMRTSGVGRPSTFSRQSSQQEAGFPGNSQQSMQSFASEGSFNMNGQDSAYAPQFSHRGQDDVRNGDFEEPPRKRMRPSESMDHSMRDDYMTVSMREPSPTEPNESFAYHSQYQADGVNVPLPPLPIPTSANANAKKDLLMSLFTNENFGESDFRTHKALTGLTPEELDTPIDTSSNTALIWAATLARKSLLRALISCGASPFRVNAIGETALMRACAVTNNLEKGTFPDLLELLGPTIEFRDSRGRTVLHHIAVTSAVKGRSQSSKYYLESLLEFVVRQGSHHNSQQSFSSGPPVNRSIPLGRFMSEIVNLRDRSGDTALNIASRIGNRSIISQLCEVGADSTIQNHSGLSPMDFGVVGDPSDLDRPRDERALGKGVGNEVKESSNEIISSITTLLAESQAEFAREMNKKQGAVDELHAALRDTSRELGEKRQLLETLQKEANEREARKLRTANLRRAYEEERGRLQQMQAQFGQNVPTGDLQLGEADQGLNISDEATKVLSNLDLRPNQPLVIDRGQRQILANALPPVHILRARLAAYTSNNQAMEESVRDLQSKSSELAGKYRKVIGLCTGVEEEDVDRHLENLLRAVESEHTDVELHRVRDFLTRVEAV